MSGLGAARPNALPGMADRAASGEVFSTSIEVRDADGRLLRTATQKQADELVMTGAGTWSGYGSKAHIRLRVALAPDSRRTLRGQDSISTGGTARLFHHNAPACRLWPRPHVVAREAGK
jgi:hypothetical protein